MEPKQEAAQPVMKMVSATTINDAELDFFKDQGTLAATSAENT